MILFTCLFHPRSGSSWLMDRLDQSPHVLADYEVLHQIRSLDEQQGAIRRVWDQGRDSGAAAAGCKIAPYQILDKGGILSFLSSNNARMIALRRSNLFDATVSQIRSEALAAAGNARGNLYRGERSLGPVDVDRAQFDRAWHAIASNYYDVNFMAQAYTGPVLCLEYEDMLHAPHEVDAQIADFLELPAAPPRNSRLTRMSTGQLESDIRNSRELLEWARQCRIPGSDAIET